jgi:hypothetical protein
VVTSGSQWLPAVPGNHRRLPVVTSGSNGYRRFPVTTGGSRWLPAAPSGYRQRPMVTGGSQRFPAAPGSEPERRSQGLRTLYALPPALCEEIASFASGVEP